MTVLYDDLRILLADDHALVRGGLSLLIKSANSTAEVIETNSFKETLNRLSNDPSIDLLLIDLHMPGENGLDGISHICETYPEVPLAVISVEADVRTIRKVLQLGAVGYIPKTSSPGVTNGAIQLILSGGIYVPPNILEMDGASVADDQETTANVGNDSPSSSIAKALGVTRRQMDVLDLVAEGKANKEIAKILGLAPGTVKMHTSRIFKLMNVSNRTEAVARYAQIKQELSAG